MTRLREHVTGAGRGHSAGFTLLEMLAALAVVALTVSLALPRAAPATSTTALRALAYEIAAVLDADRYASRRRGSVIVTNVQTHSHRIISGATGAAILWPKGVTIKGNSLGRCDETSADSGIVFYPDGYACGRSISIASSQYVIDIRVNSITGGVTIVE